MKKHLILTALSALFVTFMASCGNDSKIAGTWVQPKAEGSLVDEQGFTLLEDGNIICINTGFVEYQTWEKKGNQLIICGQYTGTAPHDFCDTMNIVQISKESMVLEQGGYEVTYVRR